MPKWLVFVLLLSSFVRISPVSAQSSVKLDLMNIDLFSEYDQPSMLVIKHFAVSQDTQLPASVTLRFPIEANLVAVAVENNGELFNQDFTGPAEQGDWQAITINVESYDRHRIEYYQPLTRDGKQREFRYEWFGDYYVKEFAVNVLLPADSTGLVTSPELQNTTSTADGSAITGTVSMSEMKMGNSFVFELAYQRESDSLTRPAQAEEVQPSQPVTEDTPGRVSIANLPLIIGAFGLALIGIALFAYWRSTQSTETKPQRRRHARGAAPEEQAYCHECGARTHAGDRFCRTCGSRIRTE